MEKTERNKKAKRIVIAVLLVLIVVAGYMVYHYKIDDTWRFKHISKDGMITAEDVDTTVVDTAKELSDVPMKDMTPMQKVRMEEMVGYLIDDANAGTMEAVTACYYKPVMNAEEIVYHYERKETGIELMMAIESYAQDQAFNSGLVEQQKQRHIVMLIALSEEDLPFLPQIADTILLSDDNKDIKGLTEEQRQYFIAAGTGFDVTLRGTTLPNLKRVYTIDGEVDHVMVMTELQDAIGENLYGILTDSKAAEVINKASAVWKTVLMMALHGFNRGTDIAREVCDLVSGNTLDESEKTKDLVMDNYEQTNVDLVINCLGGTPMWSVDGEGGYMIRMYPTELTEAAIDEANEWIKAHNESGEKYVHPITKKEFMRNPVSVNDKLFDELTDDQLRLLSKMIIDEDAKHATDPKIPYKYNDEPQEIRASQ